jgi:hypothetical protein
MNSVPNGEILRTGFRCPQGARMISYPRSRRETARIRNGSPGCRCAAQGARILKRGFASQKRRSSPSLELFNESLKMSITNSNITAELISDYAGGRLDAEDTQVIQEAINHDEVIAAAVADARRVNARMHLWLATSTAGASASDAGRTHAGRLQ